MVITLNTSNSRPWRSIGSFMYIGSAGPGPGPGGRAEGRIEGGRTGGRGVLNDSTTMFIDFQKNTTKNIVFFCRFASGGGASTDFYSSNEKRLQQISKQHSVFLTFQIRRTRKYRFLLIKTRFLDTAPDPADPAEMEHEVRLPTHQQRARGQDDVSLNKLPQTIRYSNHRNSVYSWNGGSQASNNSSNPKPTPPNWN